MAFLLGNYANLTSTVNQNIDCNEDIDKALEMIVEYGPGAEIVLEKYALIIK